MESGRALVTAECANAFVCLPLRGRRCAASLDETQVHREVRSDVRVVPSDCRHQQAHRVAAGLRLACDVRVCVCIAGVPTDRDRSTKSRGSPTSACATPWVDVLPAGPCADGPAAELQAPRLAAKRKRRTGHRGPGLPAGAPQAVSLRRPAAVACDRRWQAVAESRSAAAAALSVRAVHPGCC